MKNKIFFLSLFSACALTWTSCTDTVDYTAAGAVEGQGVYFPTSVVKSYEVEGVSGNITLEVNRTYSDVAFEAPLTATFSDGGESVFSIPSTVSFAAGSDSTSVAISYNNLERGKQYNITLSFADATPYSNSDIELSVLYPSEVVYNWVKVSEEAVLTEQLFSMYGASDIVIKDIVVEQAEGYNMYRFSSPYTNDYFSNVFGVELFSPGFEAPYIVLDGETYKQYNKYYIPSTNLGFQMVNGEGPKVDAEWNTFGSIAGNLSTSAGAIGPDDPTYPLGTYEKSTKKFDFGSVYHNLGGYGYYIIKGGFTLYLDPSLMGVDYERDYTWKDVENSKGQFISELAESVSMQSLMVAEEDPTFYKIPNLYAQGFNLYFNIKDDGTVVIPSEQKSGMTTFGNDVYMEGLSGKSSYDKESNVLTLGVSLYLADEEGNKTVELASGIEKFLWGKTEVDFLNGASTADKYVGSWSIDVVDSETMELLNSTVTITKADESTLIVKGLGFTKDYDDSVLLNYDKESGLLKFSLQQMNDFYGYHIYATLFDENNFNIDLDGNDSLIGGFNNNENIEFVNNPSNQDRWSGMVCLAVDGNSIMMLSGYYSGLEWGVPQSRVSSSVLSNNFKGLVISPKVTDTFKATLNKEYNSDKSNINFDLGVSNSTTHFIRIK